MTSILLLIVGSCYALIAIIFVAFGIVYLTRSEFMPYHQVALQREWEKIEKELQTLILALMRVTGGCFLGTGVTIILLIFAYLKSQILIILWIIPVLASLTSLGAVYATVLVKTRTPGNPPIKLSLLSIVLIILGVVALTWYSLIF